MEFPRPLTTRERATLDFLLTADVPGIEAQRIQAQSVWATGYCGCGCPTIHLEVDSERAPQAVDAPSVTITSFSDPEDPEDTLWLLLFTQGGWLSLLELAYISEQPPKEFPHPDSLESFSPPGR